MEWPLLSGLSADDRNQVLRVARRRRFGRGEVICHEGDPADSLHLIVSGRLAVRITSPSGDTAMLNLLKAGDYFGELALVRPDEDRHRSATIVALEPAETLSLAAGVFRELCKHHPSVEQLLVVLLAQRVEQLSGQLLDALYLGLDRRIYRTLIELTSVYDEQATPVVITLTQEQIADLVGGTRPSVNQVLQRLVSQGIVTLGRGRVIIDKPGELRRKAGI